ncbi:MAG: hypothetical protein IJ409_05425 [Lachnospiraceae bacterium]|nr:hypothetical protein [Lachnospiraceae bacterium]
MHNSFWKRESFWKNFLSVLAIVMFLFLLICFGTLLGWFDLDWRSIGMVLTVAIPFIIGVVIGAKWQLKVQKQGKVIGGPHYVGLPAMIGMAVGLFLAHIFFP